MLTIPNWQRKMMTAKAIERAEALSKAYAIAYKERVELKNEIEEKKHKLEMLELELRGKYTAWLKATTTYRPEVYKQKE